MSEIEIVEVAKLEIVEEELSPENVPLPTDSMITVRLSSDTTQSQSDVDSVKEMNVRDSIMSDVSGTLSQSSEASQDSTTTTSVNWEDLEKSEEQEPKDEATDEVRSTAQDNLLNHDF